LLLGINKTFSIFWFVCSYVTSYVNSGTQKPVVDTLLTPVRGYKQCP